jgi:hypothetical protein
MEWGVNWPHLDRCSGEQLETRLGPDHSYARYCRGCGHVVYLYLEGNAPFVEPLDRWLRTLHLRYTPANNILTI